MRKPPSGDQIERECDGGCRVKHDALEHLLIFRLTGSRLCENKEVASPERATPAPRRYDLQRSRGKHPRGRQLLNRQATRFSVRHLVSGMLGREMAGRIAYSTLAALPQMVVGTNRIVTGHHYIAQQAAKTLPVPLIHKLQ